MGNDKDLDQPENEPVDNGGNDDSAGGQSANEDWQKRYKGLQRKYDREIKAKDDTISSLTNRLKESNAELTSSSREYEETIADLNGTVSQLTGERDQFNTELEELRGTNAALNNELNIQNVLSDPKYAGLRSLHAAKLLNIPDGIEPGSDEFTQHLDKAVELLNTTTAAEFQNKLGAATPQNMGTNQGAGSANGMTIDEMYDWLNTNPGADKYDEILEAYTEAVADAQT